MSVSETEARAAYITMEGKRSIDRLQKMMVEQGLEPFSVVTFKTWSKKHGWVKLAAAHDEKVAAATADELAKDATKRSVTRAQQFDTLATDSLKKAIAGLKKIKPEDMKPSDIRSLAEVSVSAAKMHELLEGRATARDEGMNRHGLDTLLDDMQKELEDRLSGVGETRH